MCIGAVAGLRAQSGYITVEYFQGAKITGVTTSVLDVEIRQGSPAGVRIEMEESLQPNVYCQIGHDGVLDIGVYSRSKKNAKAIVTLSSLDYLRATNSSFVTAYGSFTSSVDSCNVLIDKHSELTNLDIRADSVRVKSTSNATVTDLRVQTKRGMLIHASGGGTISCNGTFEGSFAEVWSRQGLLENLSLKVDSAAVHSIYGGRMTGFSLDASRGVRIETLNHGRINFSGPSTAKYFDILADWGGEMQDLYAEAPAIRIEARHNSSIQAQKLTSKKPIDAKATGYSRIIGGGLDVVAKGGYRSAPDRNSGWDQVWDWVRGYSAWNAQYEDEAPDSYMRITRYENLPITGLKAKGPFEVVLSQGEKTGLQIEIPQRLEPYLQISMNQAHVISMGLHNLPNGFNMNSLPRVRVRITVARPDLISLEALCTLKAEGPLEISGKSTIRVESMSRIQDFALRAGSIDLRCEGMSKAEGLRLDGRENIALETEGMSKVSDCEVHTRNLSLKSEGMSKISVSGETKNLQTATAEGMSKISTSGLKIGK